MFRSFGSYGYSADRITLEGTPAGALAPDNIQLALTFHLPCRLRFPAGVIRFDIDDSSYIAVRNPVTLPNPSVMEDVRTAHPDESHLYTLAVVVREKPNLDPKFLTDLAQGQPGDLEDIPIEQLLSPALNAINRVVVAHNSVTSLIFGESSYPVLDGESLQMKLCIVAPAGHVLTDEEIKKLSETKPSFRCEAMSMYAPSRNIGDLSSEKLDKIKQVFSRTENYVFDEFEFASDHFRDRGEETISLLMAVVALEASHGAFLRQHLDGHGIDDKQIGEILREKGFSAMLPITACLFLAEDNRPPQAELALCLEGVQIRNAVMHAISNKSGPRMRKYTFQKIDEARQAVLDVHSRFVAAIERPQETRIL